MAIFVKRTTDGHKGTQIIVCYRISYYCNADVRCARLILLVLSPVPGEYIGWHVTGGYASLTPGYSLITRSGLIKWSRASARLGIT